MYIIIYTYTWGILCTIAYPHTTYTHTKKIIKYSIMKYNAGPTVVLLVPRICICTTKNISRWSWAASCWVVSFDKDVPKKKVDEIGSCCIHGYTFCGFSLQETAKVRRGWDEKGERCTTTRETSCDVLSSFRWNRKAQSWYRVHPIVSETVWGSKGSGWRAQQGDRESPNVWLLCKSNNE